MSHKPLGMSEFAEFKVANSPFFKFAVWDSFLTHRFLLFAVSGT